MLQARLDICSLWLETIEKREAAAYVIPGGLMHNVRTIANQLREAQERLNEYVEQYPAARVDDAHGAAAKKPSEQGVLSGIGENQRLVLEHIMLAHDRGEDGATINGIATATGLTYPTARRLLMKLQAVSLVRQKKHDRHGAMRAEGPGSTSPPDIFSIPQLMRASCRRVLEAARKTP